jgi:hypothetical protein
VKKNFFLKKWYLDAADHQGNVYIGYHVALQWRHLELHGYQHVWRTSKNGMQTQAGLTKQPLPVWEDKHRLIWQPHHLTATWDSVADGIDETLYCTDQGEIMWHCTQPKAKAQIHLPHLSFSGWGYTEYIDMTIPVWELTFDHLYWGRCHSKNHYLVWIKWEGATTQQLMWHNGKRATDLTITSNDIRGSDCQLTLGVNIPLRQGKLISTVFQPYHHVTRLLPEATFLADEHKWYNLGQVESQTGSEPAVSIYEEVVW